ncbi:MAG: RHS repeat-associated core domain-containing protein [Lutibacter sp.]|nr:RHS repeat-associated core domain-containing protein [Lutibacter sp.]
MKKYLLLGIALLWITNSFSQKVKNPEDKFTYKKIKVIDESSGTLPILGASDLKSSSSTNVSARTINDSGIGETQGALSVSLTGGASYNIPIAVPLGINGVIPEISLAYNSQSGNGLAGYGWNISGVSGISRIPSTKFHDNIIDPVDFDDLDRFSLDGQRLILKSGVYGKDGAQYETENYSNLKIISYGVSPYGVNYGPSYFIIQYPDGSIAHYGHSTDSNSHTNYAITYWQNPQGVRINYEYINESNSLYISKIKYGSLNSNIPMNEIQFIYWGRNRNETAYVGDVLFIRKEILKEIKVLANGYKLRSYILTYNSTSLNYSRLIQIQENTPSTIHSPIYFNYTNSPNAVNYSATTSIGLNNIEQRNAETLSLDLTGNGKMDFIVYPKNTSEKNKFWLFKNLQSGVYNIPDEINTGSSFENVFPVTWLNSTNKILPGLAVIQNTTNNQVSFKVYSNGTVYPIYYQYEKLWSAPTYNYENSCDSSTSKKKPIEYISGDFNGDGLNDVIAITKSYTSRSCYKEDPNCVSSGGVGDPLPIMPKQNSKKINAEKSDIQNKIGETDSQRIEPIDTTCPCNCSTYTSNSSYAYFINLDRRISSGFAKSLGYLQAGLKSTDKLLTADVNGDGKTDILHVTEGNIYVYNLDSNNYLQLLWQTSDSRIKLDYPLLLGDYNGDGKTDFLVPKENNSNYFTNFSSSGMSFKSDSFHSWFPFTFIQNDWNGKSETLYGYSLIPVDINGDGRTDIIDYRTTTYNDSSDGKQEITEFSNSYSPSSYGTIFANGITATKTGNSKHFPIPIFLSSDKLNKKLEFASISDNSITLFTFTQDHREDVLLRAIENNGVTHSINYNSLDPSEYTSDYTSVYQPAYSESYPYADLDVAPDSKVVTSLQRACSGTPTLQQKYSYYGGVYNLEGLGFIGFKGTAKSNWHTDNSDRIFNVSKYDTQLRGAITEDYILPYSFNFTSTPSNYISKTSFVYSSSLSASKVFKLWNSSSITQNSLNGTITNKSYLYDIYNNPTKITSNFTGHGNSVIDITYENSTGSTYYIGRPTSEKETTTIGGNTFSTEKQFSYSGYLLTQKNTKGNGTPFDSETYTYDVFGNILKKITTPYNTPAREVHFEYDNSGRYLTKSTDAEGLGTTYQYNTDLGTLTKEINPFGQETNYLYDGWNRLIKVTDYLGKNLTTSYVESNYYYTVTDTGDDGSGKITEYDPLKRVTTVKEKDVLGQWISKSYLYDKFDRIWKESEPYTGLAASQWNINEYDFYGRPIKQTSFTGKVTSLTYNGLSVVVDDGTKTVTTTKNAMGNVTSVTDPGGTINYTYFGNGTMKTADYNGVIVSTEQDGWGRKTKTSDPSAGIYTYTYNGFGEVIKETTPKGTTDYTYSSIGKLLEKKVVGNLTNMTMQYAYNATNKKLGSLSLINSDGNNSTYSYTYDNYQRLSYSSETNTYAQFTKQLSYDTFGRVDTEENYAKLLANGKSSIQKIKSTYQNGALKTISDNATQEIIWNVNELNARGQATSITMGNNLRNKNVYNISGYLNESTVEKNINTTPEQLMKLSFNFDSQKGLLNLRTNSLFSWTENFTYDNMDRLVSFNDNESNKNHTYDAQGRVTANNTVGTYNYTGKSYKLENIDLTTQGFLHYAKMDRQDISYNAFKSPVEINEAGKDRVSFQYNAFMGRANMFYGNTEIDKLVRPLRRHYSYDGSMEISFDLTTGKTTFVTYIGGDAYSAPAIWRSEQGATSNNNYYFLHRDYLGSILMISDINGVIKEKRHFDAWGNIAKLTDGNNTALDKFVYLDRGYTGHEHLQGVNLIHMNGRLYDPVLHRFLAPDNYIQDPYNTQNYNRYGYVLNNPLKYTDPSGEYIPGLTEYLIVAVVAWLAGTIIKSAITSIKANQGDYAPPAAAITPSSGQNNSQNSTALPNAPPIPGSGYRLDNPYGVQNSFLQSSTSSELAYSTTGPNDWIANGNGIESSKKGLYIVRSYMHNLLLTALQEANQEAFYESKQPYSKYIQYHTIVKMDVSKANAKDVSDKGPIEFDGNFNIVSVKEGFGGEYAYDYLSGNTIVGNSMFGEKGGGSRLRNTFFDGVYNDYYKINFYGPQTSNSVLGQLLFKNKESMNKFYNHYAKYKKHFKEKFKEYYNTK